MRHTHVRALRGAIVLASLAVIAVVPNLAGATPPVDTARVTVGARRPRRRARHRAQERRTEPPVECPTECLFTVDVGTKLSFKRAGRRGLVLRRLRRAVRRHARGLRHARRRGDPPRRDVPASSRRSRSAAGRRQGLGHGQGPSPPTARAPRCTRAPRIAATARARDASRPRPRRPRRAPPSAAGTASRAPGCPENCGVTVQRSVKVYGVLPQGDRARPRAWAGSGLRPGDLERAEGSWSRCRRTADLRGRPAAPGSSAG